MSNCVGFKSDLVLDSKDIDINGFVNMVESVINLHEAPEDAQGYFAWWFLGDIEVVVPGELIIIHLGNGRSTHTFRDFHGMRASCIKPYLKQDRNVELIAMDLENPQDGWMRWSVSLSGDM